MNEPVATDDKPDNRETSLRQFMARAGLDLADYTLLDNALTHSSYLPGKEAETIQDYEALEFLGDAVLGLAIAHYLFDRFPGSNPGEYTKLRATVVNKNTVARVARSLDIAPLIRLGKGEENIGGRKRNALLADSLEAVIGAIYISAGWHAAYQFVIGGFKDELEKVCTAPPTWDYKSMLQTYCQAKRCELPQFDMIRSSGPDHCKHFEVQVSVNGRICGRGEGSSKKQAEQNAAYQALKEKKILE